MASLVQTLKCSAQLQLQRWIKHRRVTTYTQMEYVTRGVTTYTQMEYVTRRATDDDYDAIKDVSRQAHNHGYRSDYMAGMLAVYMKDNNRVIHVVERTKDKKIIGSAMALGGLDQGVTFHGEAGRSVPEYQNRGLLNNLMLSINTDFNSRWPAWDHFKGSSTQTHFYDKVLEKIDLQVIRFALRIRLDRGQLERYISSDDNNTDPQQIPQPVSSSALCLLLDDPHQRAFLYPDGYMVLEHNIMRAEASNIHFVTDYHDDMLMSGDVMTLDAALSIGGIMTVNDDQTWRYNVNYTGAPSVDICNQHLRHLLRHNMDSFTQRDETFLVLMMPNTMKVRYGEDELARYWGTQFGSDKQDITPLTQYCFNYLAGVRDRLTSPSDIKRKQESGSNTR